MILLPLDYMLSKQLKLSLRSCNIMSPKRLFFVSLLLMVMVIISGCATTEKSKEERFLTQYRNAGDDCIRWGHVRESDGYHRCIYTLLGLKKYLVYDDIESEYENNFSSLIPYNSRTILPTGLAECLQ